MKKTFNIIFSEKTTVILLMIFAVAIGVATFIENKYDTETADILIYNSWWLEIILLLLALNFIGNIKKYKLFQKEKLSGLIFHSAFIIMIIGAGVTRYFGWDGEIRILEKEDNNLVYIAEPILISKIVSGNDTLKKEIPIQISQIQNNYFDFSIPTQTNGNILISYKDYIENAIKESNFKKTNNIKIVELIIVSNSGQEIFFIPEKEFKIKDNVKITYNMGIVPNAININDDKNKLELFTSYDLILTTNNSDISTIKEKTTSIIEEGNVYNTQKGIIFQFKHLHKNTTIKNLKKITKEERLLDALVLNIDIKGKDYAVTVYGQNNFIAQDQEFNLGGTKLIFAYGFKSYKLPFSIYLKDFYLQRYPGSSTPSSLRSEIIIIDKKRKFQKEFLISHNNIVDYRGYRFFQLSYDDDEKGTILSVNYDMPGTWITYFSYSLLIVGFLLTLLNKNSRFLSLFSKLKK